MSLEVLVGMLRIISQIFALIGVPLIIYVARTLKRMDERQAMHHQTLYGETGTNGLRSDMKAAGSRLDSFGETMNRHTWDITDLKACVERLERTR